MIFHRIVDFLIDLRLHSCQKFQIDRTNTFGDMVVQSLDKFQFLTTHTPPHPNPHLLWTEEQERWKTLPSHDTSYAR